MTYFTKTLPFTLLIGSTLYAVPASAQINLPTQPSLCIWAGNWNTNFGDITLSVDGSDLTGSFNNSDKNRLVGSVKSTRSGKCEAELVILGKPGQAGLMRVKKLTLNGSRFSGSLSDKVTDGKILTELTGMRDTSTTGTSGPLMSNSTIRTSELAGEIERTNSQSGARLQNSTTVRQGTIAMTPKESLSQQLGEQPVAVERNAAVADIVPLSRFGDRAVPNGSEGTPSKTPPTSNAAEHPYAKHIPALAGKPASFMPRYIELELMDFRNETRLSSDVYGLMGFYAGCNSDEGASPLKPLRGQENRVLDSNQGTSNVAGKTAILSRPSSYRKRRFSLDMGCYNKPGGELFVQVQTNLKRHLPLMVDPKFGYEGFDVNLSDLMRQDDGKINQSIDLLVVESGCADGEINTVKRETRGDTASSMAFDWRFSATAPMLAVPKCDFMTESRVRISFVE